MQLHPRESFAVVRQIEDHTDSTTYYVRAVIRNAKTDAIIQVGGLDYLNLSDKGSRRFAANWLVPADPSGQGFWVNILTSVYTDSGYTTKSQNYGDKLETYLVQDRVNVNLGGIGGGGGPDIDYKKIQKMIDASTAEVIKKFPKIKDPEKVQIPDIASMLLVLGKSLSGQISGIKIPEATKLEPVLKDLKALAKQLGDHTGENRQQYMESITKVINELRFVARFAEEFQETSKAIKDFPKMIGRLEEALKSFKLEVPEIGLSLKSPKFNMGAPAEEAGKRPHDQRVSKLLR